jgi:hypothetical protein
VTSPDFRYVLSTFDWLVGYFRSRLGVVSGVETGVDARVAKLVGEIVLPSFVAKRFWSNRWVLRLVSAVVWRTGSLEGAGS